MDLQRQLEKKARHGAMYDMGIDMMARNQMPWYRFNIVTIKAAHDTRGFNDLTGVIFTVWRSFNDQHFYRFQPTLGMDGVEPWPL